MNLFQANWKQRAYLLALIHGLLACTNSDTQDATASLTIEELMKPETCEDCHQGHFKEWSSSMHAYAAKDPMFLAMNARGQKETDGQLGNFCVRCHAPMAVIDKRTTNGENLAELGSEYQGVTCYFCHNIESVSEVHDNPLGLPANNPMELAHDTTMRGGLADAQRPPAHGVAYSSMHDGDDPASSGLCGPCHDIVTDNSVHLERTFLEWQGGVQSKDTSCIGCHMDSYTGIVADTDTVQVDLRPAGVHRHLMPGVDTALTDFPGKDVQLKAIACALRNAVTLTLTMRPDRSAEVWLETDVGHHWPTGAAQDRRAWLEVHAYDRNGAEVFSVGQIADDQPLPSRETAPNLVQMRDWIYDADGNEAHMFWDVAPSEAHPTGIESNTLVTRKPNGVPHTKEIPFNFPAATARVTAQVRIRAIGHDVIDNLVESGSFTAAEGAALKAEVKTHALASSLTVWEEADGYGQFNRSEPNDLSCPDDWKCLLYPDDPSCLD